VGLETRPPPEGEPAPPASEAGAVEGSAASLPPAPAAASGLPDFAKNADDLEAIKKAVDDAASVGGGLWLSYLFVLFYLAVAAGAVTHADLFLENPVKLPFLNIELPLLAFFFLAPILFIIVHAYTLVHLVFLTDKAKRFDQALYKQIGADETLSAEVRDRNAAIRSALRRQLPSNIFVQFLAGASDVRDSAFGYLLRAIAWVTLVVAPVLLLLMMQIQFLPFHSSFIIWTQRAALLADLILIWWLWRKILSGRMPGPYLGPRLLWATAGVASTLVAFLFSWTVATFPSEWQDDLPNQRLFWFPFPKPDRELVTLHRLVFESKVDETTRHRRLPFSSTLVLTGFNVLEGLGIDDPKKAEWRDFVFRARGRDLRGAIFDFAVLTKVDFTGAKLEGASLGAAQLQGSSLFQAELQGSTLDLVHFPGGSLIDARLEGASLDDADLQGALLNDAQLEGASLGGAHLEGASLIDAHLEGASLSRVQLQGASLREARLQGAYLDDAHLEGASLYLVQLQGASLNRANLEAADFSNTLLWRSQGSSGVKAKTILFTYLSAAGENAAWEPNYWDDRGMQPWDGAAYQRLRNKIEALLKGGPRDGALQRIRALDCSSADNALASCDPSTPSPSEAKRWRQILEAASLGGETYTKALALSLKGLVCSGADYAIYVVHAVGFQSRLEAAGAAALGLINDLLNKDSKDCPVAAVLTETDKVRLLQIKQQIEAAK